MTLVARLTALIQVIGADIKELQAAQAALPTSVPTFVTSGQTVRIPAGTQMLYTLPIELDDGANLDIEGELVELA